MVPSVAEYFCPHCNQRIEIHDAQSQQIVVCPQCGQEFILPELEIAQTEVGDLVGQDQQLDATRIRQFTSMRRALCRTRSYAIIAAAGCSAAVAQLGVMAVREALWVGWSLWLIGYIALVVVAAFGAWHFIGQAIELNQSTKRSSIAENLSHEPDFSGLSEGSLKADDLERIE